MAIIAMLLTAQSGKANDTIRIQLPGGIHNICVDPGNLPTFVLHKPIGFGSTVWNINGPYYGTGDSIVFTPSIAGSYDVGATWNSNPENVVLMLFSSTPSHADFSVFSGGSVNATNDTIWMCGASVSVLSNTIGSEATSYTWTGPGGFINSSDDPVILTAPGTYYFARPNSCGTTTDTIVVVQLPTAAPVWTADTTFCNVPVNLTLDAGPGWNYSWNTGVTTQTITVSDTGFYKVTVTNACKVDSAWIHVAQQTYPLPDLMGYIGTPLCYNASLTLDPNPSYMYDSYVWNTGVHTSTITVSGPTAVYTVTVSKGACLSFASVPIEFYALPDQPSISIATVDEVTGFNKVVFHPTTSHTSVIDKYNVYKLSGTYTLLGSVSPDSPVMTFIDSTSNPMISANRYKVSAVDTCGDESELSYGHGTIKINSNPGTGGVIDLTIVDPYWDESGQYSPSKYYILIDSLNDGNLAVMDSMDAVYHSYTVTQPFAGATYLIGVAFPWARVSGLYGTKSLTLDQMSISNKSAVVSGINDYDSDIAVSIYPNPSTGVFTVNGEGVLKIVVTDLAGRVLQTYTTTSTIDLSGFAAGIYTAKISNAQGSTNRQLVITK